MKRRKRDLSPKLCPNTASGITPDTRSEAVKVERKESGGDRLDHSKVEQAEYLKSFFLKRDLANRRI